MRPVAGAVQAFSPWILNVFFGDFDFWYRESDFFCIFAFSNFCDNVMKKSLFFAVMAFMTVSAAVADEGECGLGGIEIN